MYVRFRVGPYLGIGILVLAIILFLRFPNVFFGNVKPIPGLAGKPSQGEVFISMFDLKKWNEAVKALGGIEFSPALAQDQIDQYRQQTGQTAPALPPEAEAPPAAPAFAEGQQPHLVQPDMVVKSYPPETYESSAAFIDARLTGFERLHEGWGFMETADLAISVSQVLNTTYIAHWVCRSVVQTVV